MWGQSATVDRHETPNLTSIGHRASSVSYPYNFGYLAYSQSSVWDDICQGMTAWDAIGCSDQSQYPIRICWQWLTVGGTPRKLCTDRCMIMRIRKFLRLCEELRNLSQMSLRKYLGITKNVAECLGLQREVPHMWSTSVFSLTCTSPHPHSSSHPV